MQFQLEEIGTLAKWAFGEEEWMKRERREGRRIEGWREREKCWLLSPPCQAEGGGCPAEGGEL